MENWDKDPKPASLWWTSTDAKKESEDIVFEPAGGKHTPPLADEFRILGHLFSRDGRMQISLEERMQSANKAWWRETRRYTDARACHGT